MSPLHIPASLISLSDTVLSCSPHQHHPLRRTADLKPALVTEFKASQGNLVNYSLKTVSKRRVDGLKVHVLTDSTRETRA